MSENLSGRSDIRQKAGEPSDGKTNHIEKAAKRKRRTAQKTEEYVAVSILLV